MANSTRSTKAGSINPANRGFTYGQLALVSAEKIMGIAGRFAAPGNQTIENLAHLKADQIVGEWRDSTYGMFNSDHVGSLLCVHMWSA
jgi:hypothetical protein